MRRKIFLDIRLGDLQIDELRDPAVEPLRQPRGTPDRWAANA
jgi:hypothetical protein